MRSYRFAIIARARNLLRLDHLRGRFAEVCQNIERRCKPIILLRAARQLSHLIAHNPLDFVIGRSTTRSTCRVPEPIKVRFCFSPRTVRGLSQWQQSMLPLMTGEQNGKGQIYGS
jgi:hypothetical protein